MASFEGFNSAAGVEQRIGDTERDQATEYLRDHMASGRLDSVEFDERVEKALTAHFQSDLDQLFVDLPAPRPEPALRAATPPPAPTPITEPVPVSQSGACGSRRPAAWNLMIGLLWAAAISVCILGHWQVWWLMFIPLMASGGFGRHQRYQRHLQRHQLHPQQLPAHQFRTRDLH